MSPSSVNGFGEVLKWERFVCTTVNERIYPSGSSVVCPCCKSRQKGGWLGWQKQDTGYNHWVPGNKSEYGLLRGTLGLHVPNTYVRSVDSIIEQSPSHA